MGTEPGKMPGLVSNSLALLMRDPERLSRFYAAATRLSSAESLEGVLERTARAARRLAQADLAKLTVVEEGTPDGGRVFSAGHAAGIAAALEQPILVHGRPFATLRLEAARTSFEPAERALIELLCVHAGLAIEKIALQADEQVLVRVRNALGVLASTAAEAAVRQVGEIRLDLGRYQAFVAGSPVHLTPSEFRLLELLTEEPGRTYTRYEIVERLWGTDSASSLRTADIHVTRLRRKLEPDPAHPRYVETVRGVGYRLAPG